MSTIVKMPQLAAGEETATVQAWLVEVGDTVAQGQAIVEVETEKATVDFEAEASGVFAGVLVPAGSTVEVGSAIAVIAAEGEDLEAALASHAQGTTAADGQPTIDAVETGAERRAPDVPLVDGDAARRFASPIARRLAKEHGIPVAQLQGTGPGGRVVRRDIEDYLASAPVASLEAQVSDASGPVSPTPERAPFEDIPHTGMRRAIARRLTESKTTVPHFYLVADVRVDDLLALRREINDVGDAKISVNDLVIKAVAKALQDVPDANAIWTDDATRRYSSVDIAVAVSVPGGLLTPVLRRVESLTLSEISAQMRDVALRAREGRLKQDELEGGSFSVSNLGMYGTREFSAILNPPQSGILAVGAAAKQPVVDAAGQLGVATVMRVTLSADHRVLDGAVGAEWLAAFVRRVEHPLTMLI